MESYGLQEPWAEPPVEGARWLLDRLWAIETSRAFNDVIQQGQRIRYWVVGRGLGRDMRRSAMRDPLLRCTLDLQLLAPLLRLKLGISGGLCNLDYWQ